MIDIVNIGNYKTKYNDKNNVKFENLNFYLTLAKKNIAKFADQICPGSSMKMLNSEDAIANVANGIMMADWRWDKDRKGDTGQSKTKYSYRNQCAIWSIQSYITRQYNSKKNVIRNKSVSLDHNYDDDLNLKNILPTDHYASVLDKIIKSENTENLKDDIRYLLDSDILSERQVEYIKMYYFEQMTLESIGKHFNITREAVRQGLKKAYIILRKALEIND